MLDKDKLFLIIYFGVKNRKFNEETNQIMYGIYSRIRESLDDSVNVYIIPQVTTDEVKFELLNVEKCTDEKITDITNTFNLILDEFKKR